MGKAKVYYVFLILFMDKTRKTKFLSFFPWIQKWNYTYLCMFVGGEKKQQLEKVHFFLYISKGIL